MARRWAAAWLVALLGAGLFLLGRWNERGGVSAGGPAGGSAGRIAASEGKGPPGGGARAEMISAAGAVRPTGLIEVGNDVTGTVVEVFAHEGDAVKKGQRLGRLDPTGFEANVARERARLAAAEAQVRGASGAAQVARATLETFRQIAARSGGKVPSAREMAKAQGELAQAEAAEAVGRATLSEARTALRLAEASLGKSTLRSPIDGVVLTRRVQPGQGISAGGPAAPFRLAESLSAVELSAGVDQAEVAAVRAGQSATITVDASPGRRYEGVVTRVGLEPRVEGGAVLYPVAIRVKNGDLGLRPGMTGSAEIAAAPAAAPRS